MKTFFFLKPRGSGKTTLAMYEYSKDPENSIYIANNNYMANYIQVHMEKNFKGLAKNFISADGITVKLSGRRPKNIILDEYSLFLNPEEIYNMVHAVNPENVYIFSTGIANTEISVGLYTAEIYNFVKQNKKGNTYFEVLNKYASEYKLTSLAQNSIYELYHHFITDENTIVIQEYSNGTREYLYR